VHACVCGASPAARAGFVVGWAAPTCFDVLLQESRSNKEPNASSLLELIIFARISYPFIARP
jgi:hypothetical protein